MCKIYMEIFIVNKRKSTSTPKLQDFFAKLLPACTARMTNPLSNPLVQYTAALTATASLCLQLLGNAVTARGSKHHLPQIHKLLALQLIKCFMDFFLIAHWSNWHLLLENLKKAIFFHLLFSHNLNLQWRSFSLNMYFWLKNNLSNFLLCCFAH